MVTAGAVTPSSDLVGALEATYHAQSDALSLFAAIAGEDCPGPDFLEWSAVVSSRCEARRLTYYFDFHRHGVDVMRSLGGRFSRLAAALRVTVPAKLVPAFEARIGVEVGVQQVVLGVDDRAGSRRVKLYLVLSRAAPSLVDAMLASVDVARPTGFDGERVYILGLECDTGGLADAKLYCRLDPTRLGRVVKNLRAVADLLPETREVVWQRCLRRDREQLYFHVSRSSALLAHLTRRAAESSAARELLADHAAVGSHLTTGRLEPWIVSYPLQGHRLAFETSNVYFHLAADGQPARAAKIR